MAHGALSGVTIVELAGIGPGPFAGMMLADHGAQVVRVERPGSADDPTDVLARSRTVVRHDLKTPKGVAAVRDLARSADGLIEGFRPGVTERLGLGPDVLLGDNPRLVYGRMTGWGQEGPLARAAGHDINYIALVGALHAFGRAGGGPVPPINLVGDFGGGGMMLAFGMLAGILSARATGAGQVVDCAMVDGASLLMSMVWGFRAKGLWGDERGTNYLDTGAPYYDVYATRDGGHVALGAIEPQFYAELLRRTGLADDPVLADQHGPGGLQARRDGLTALFASRTRAEWCALLEGSDACFAPVLGFDDARRHPHMVERQAFVDVAGVVQPSPAPRFSATPAPRPRAPGAGRRVTAEGVTDQLRRRAAAWLDRPALECEGRVSSYRDLFGRADAVARRLVADGVRFGERVGYLGRNSDRYFVLLLGVAASGGVMTPVGWRLTLSEILFIVDDAGIRRMFVEPGFEGMAAALLRERPAVRLVSTERPLGILRGFDDWIADGGGAVDLPAIAAGDAFVQLYTSGTTGRPKGVVLSHGALFALRPEADRVHRDWDRWTSEDVSVVAMPVAHVSGTNYGLVALYNGVTALVMPEFDVARLLRIIDRENVTKIFLVPSALAALLRHPDAATTDFSRLRFLNYGSSPIPLPLLREAMRVMGCGFVQHYGMTETSGTVVTLGPEDHVPEGSGRMRSAGRAEPGVGLRIVDADLRDVPAGMTGEVLIRAANAFTGYWNRPDADAETLVDGWVRTGDAGYLDADGYLFIQDRLKDMVITGGENVYPAEVESVLHEHPAIADVAVIGVPDDRWGEAVTAVAVAAGDPAAFDADAVLAWARGRLAAYKVPKRILLTDALPRNASGKVLRRELRAPFWRDADRKVA